jgi:hypothetical protein
MGIVTNKKLSNSMNLMVLTMYAASMVCQKEAQEKGGDNR